MDELAEAAQWLGHIVRSAISAALTTNLGLTITSEKEEKLSRGA